WRTGAGRSSISAQLRDPDFEGIHSRLFEPLACNLGWSARELRQHQFERFLDRPGGTGSGLVKVDGIGDNVMSAALGYRLTQFCGDYLDFSDRQDSPACHGVNL